MHLDRAIDSLRCEIQSISAESGLARLGEIAIAAHDAALSDSIQAKQKIHSGIEYAVTCGQALIKIRDGCQQGQWLTWLAMNCPKISRPTAYRYIKLANDGNFSHVINAEPKGLRQAYLLADIINEPKKKVTRIDRDPQPFKPDALDVKPLDFDYDAVSFDVGIESVSLGEIEGPIHKLTDALDVLFAWGIKGEIATIGQRFVALAWAMGKFDADKFDDLPSLSKMAEVYHVNDTSLSRYSAEASARFHVKNRAQSHGDGVRK